MQTTTHSFRRALKKTIDQDSCLGDYGGGALDNTEQTIIAIGCKCDIHCSGYWWHHIGASYSSSWILNIARNIPGFFGYQQWIVSGERRADERTWQHFHSRRKSFRIFPREIFNAERFVVCLHAWESIMLKTCKLTNKIEGKSNVTINIIFLRTE